MFNKRNALLVLAAVVAVYALGHFWKAPGETGPCRWTVHRVEHHVAHAASAYLPSGFDRAAILTIDRT